ncbi:MAG TPA: hypothetical protein DEA71_19415 [Nitrospira sp.]|nr:hypothetical protein [Nitrospira sp.]
MTYGSHSQPGLHYIWQGAGLVSILSASLGMAGFGNGSPLPESSIAQQAYLKASNPDPNDKFGSAIAIDGDTLVVGAQEKDSGSSRITGNQSNNSGNDIGTVYVFVRSGGIWTQQAYLKASNPDDLDTFGTSVAISGNTIVVGAQGEDSNASGVTGNQSNNSVAQAGAAYVLSETAPPGPNKPI